MKIEVGKRYRDCDGEAVKITEVSDSGAFAIGVYEDGGQWAMWRVSDGRWMPPGTIRPGPWDLVEEIVEEGQFDE